MPISHEIVSNAHVRHCVPLMTFTGPQSLRSFSPAAGIESSGSNHFEITKEITEFCPSGLNTFSAGILATHSSLVFLC